MNRRHESVAGVQVRALPVQVTAHLVQRLAGGELIDERATAM